MRPRAAAPPQPPAAPPAPRRAPLLSPQEPALKLDRSISVIDRPEGGGERRAGVVGAGSVVIQPRAAVQAAQGGGFSFGGSYESNAKARPGSKPKSKVRPARHAPLFPACLRRRTAFASACVSARDSPFSGWTHH